MERIRCANQGRIRTVLLLGWLFVATLISACQAQDYRLGPDDVLSVTVLRHPELSVEAVTVTQDGKIRLPMAGEIMVSGKTPEATGQAIIETLKSRLVNPEVTVAVRQGRTERVFVLGAVAHPGIFDSKPGWRITEALAAAGGLTTRPEMCDAAILRLNRESVKLDLPKLLSEASQDANVALLPGDVLTVTERTIRVSVAGQVQRPGAYDLPTGGGVVEAIALAGGSAPKAALTKASIKHADGVVQPVDLFKVLVLGEMGENLKLRAGDLVMIPESKAKVAVLGAVRLPGYYDIEEGTAPKATDLIAMAGGADKQARINQTAVMRLVDDQPKRITVNLERILKQGKTNEDMLVKNGDVIYVPDSKFDWDFALRAVSSFSVLSWIRH